MRAERETTKEAGRKADFTRAHIIKKNALFLANLGDKRVFRKCLYHSLTTSSHIHALSRSSRQQLTTITLAGVLN